MKIKLTMIALLGCILTGCGVNTNPGTGTRTGQIIMLRKEGIFCKTWEAEIIKGGMSGGSGSFGVQPFYFTLQTDDQAKQFQGYMDKQTEVEIQYHTKGIYSCFRSSSGGDFLDSVIVMTNK